jgi:hypothetical protein
MVKKDLESKTIKEAIIEIKDAVIEIQKSVKDIYGSINDMTLSLYHIIKDRRSYQDMLEGDFYPR